MPPEDCLQSNLNARSDTLASEQDIPCYEFKYKKDVQVGAREASRDEAAGFRVVTRYWELGVSPRSNRKLSSNLDNLIPRQVEVVDRLARIA